MNRLTGGCVFSGKIKPANQAIGVPGKIGDARGRVPLFPE
jgi:hypothetical protein